MDALTCRLATTFASINSLVSQVFQKPGRPKCSQAIIESKILRRIQSHPSYRTFIQASSIHQPSFTSYSPSSILSQIQMHPSYRTFVGPVTRPLGPKNQESKIESLPNEIQVMIMRQLRDVPSLRSLSASSRSLNELRLSHASVILPSVLRTELGEGVLTDALWVMKASEIDWDSSNYRRNLQTFMEDWSDPMSTTLLLSNAPLPYYVEIARFLPRLWGLVKGFCDHAWSTPIMSSSMLDSELQISSSEKVRIARALLRIQFYCFLYATPREAECEHVYEDGKSYEVQCQSYKVFGHWKAWEIEEIACVRDYIYFKLAEVFQNIRREAAKSPLDIVILQPWDDEPDVVNSNQVIFDDDFLPSWVDASSPCGANLSPEGTFYDTLREMFLSRGIGFLSDLFSAHPREQLGMFQSIMHELLVVGIDFEFLSSALHESPDALRKPSEDVEAAYHGDEELFQGDEDAAGPNLAWTWAHEQKFQPYYACTDHMRLRRWGYVMWDYERLIKVDACRSDCSHPEIYDNTERRKLAITKIHRQACLRESNETITENEDQGYLPTSEQDLLSTVEAEGEAEPESDNKSEDGLVVNALPAAAQPRFQHDDDMSDDESELSDQAWEDVPLFASTANAGSVFDHSNEVQEDEAIEVGQIRLVWNDERSSQGVKNTSTDALATFVKLPNPFDDQLGEHHACVLSPITEVLPPTIKNFAPASGTFWAPPDIVKQDHVLCPSKDESGTDAENLSADQNAPKVERISKQLPERKIARVVSPKAKLLKLQQDAAQKDELSPSKLMGEKEHLPNINPTTSSTAIQTRASSPHSSDYSGSASDSGRSHKSEASSRTSSELSVVHHATTTSDTHVQCKDMLDVSSKGTFEDTTRLYLSTKDPSEVAAWINGSKLPQSPPPSPQSSSRLSRILTASPPSSTIPHRDSSEGSISGTNADTNLTKKQRKKANRKARKAAASSSATTATENGTLQINEPDKEEQAIMEEQTKNVPQKQGVEMTTMATKAEEGKEEINTSKSNGGENIGVGKTKKNEKGAATGKGNGKDKKGGKRKTVGYLFG